MKKLRDKFVYWKKRMVFRLGNWLESLADWDERHPILSWAWRTAGDFLWFMIKVWICIDILLELIIHIY